jgi:urease accessory protein
MRSEILVVAHPDRMPRIECRGAIQGRHTSPDTVHLVSSAITPLGGDTIAVRLVVEPRARLRLRSAAATLTLPGPETRTSHSDWDCVVAGDLDVDLEPTVVAGDSRHLSSIRVDITAAGRVRWRERVQIGRSGEREGFWSGSLHADIDGAPLLRHRVELGAGSIADDELGAPLACISELHYPATTFDTEGTRLELAAGGCLATWQGPGLTMRERTSGTARSLPERPGADA